MIRRGAALVAGALVLVLGREAQAQADSLARRPFTFVTLGHIRGKNDGKLNPKLGELMERVRAVRPDLVVLTGDIIFGDVQSDPADTAEVRREWNEVDSALATLGVPTLRVPGNHDISDLGTRDLWWGRYGRIPAVVERFGSRFILLGSAWIPADGDTRHQRIVRPEALDTAQVAFLRQELARPGSWDHTFVLQHHTLWWDDAAPWWKDVHPMLARAGVTAVFAGDYGPMKFSHLTRDSVRYLQASMEGIMTLQTLQNFERSRVLSSQFDNFLVVKVDGPSLEVGVETVGEFTSPQFQPAFFDSMMPKPKPTGWRADVAELATPRKLAALGGLVILALGLGFLIGRMGRRQG
jgi:Calcineurin-like phosphoesterase